MNDSIDRLKAIQDKWRKEYDKTIEEKLKTLESLIQEMQKGIQEPTFKSFRVEIHKIAGSAGTVGYDAVSVFCKQLDTELSDMLDQFKVTPPDPSIVTRFQSDLSRIRELFSNTASS